MNIKHKIISLLSIALTAVLLIVSAYSGIIAFADETIGEKPLDRIVTGGGLSSIFHKIGVIGDSLSSGEFEGSDENNNVTFNDMYDYSWGQVMARDTGAKVFNFSKGGLTAKSFLEDQSGYGAWEEGKRCQAYIIALGVNDLLNQKFEVGQPSDVDLADPQKQENNFAYYYGAIIKKIRKIQPDARIFLMTMPHDMYDGKWEIKNAHRKLLEGMAEYFGGYTYVIDLLEYMPMHDEAFHNNFYLGGHLNPMGYILTARAVESYIDYIIRYNPRDFDKVGFIDTESEQAGVFSGSELPVYRKLLESYDNLASVDGAVNLWEPNAVSKSLMNYNGGKALMLDVAQGSGYKTAQFKLNADRSFSLVDDKAPYLVFDMDIPDLHGGYLGLYFEVNTKNAGALKANAKLEYSECFADPTKPIYIKEPNKWSVYETPDWNKGKMQYRINLKEAFGNNFKELGECWSFDLKIANFSKDAETHFVFDNFALQGETNATVLKKGSETVISAGGGKSGSIALSDSGAVNLIDNGAHDLYWYMDVDIPVSNVANIGIKLMTDGWSGDEGLIKLEGALACSESLSELVSGGGSTVKFYNSGWEARVPKGGNWYRLDLSKAFNLNDSETVNQLNKAVSLWLAYNQWQSNSADGGNPNIDFSGKTGSIRLECIFSYCAEALYGDVNLNGSTDITDLVKLKEYIDNKNGVYVSSSADMNGDREINLSDITLLREMLLKAK